MFIGPCIIVIVEELKTNLMSLIIFLFHLLFAQHVSDILMSETCWANNKWNKNIISDITLVFNSSTMVFLLHSFPLWPYMRESTCKVEIVCCMCRSHWWLQWNAVSYTWEASTYPYCLHWLQSWRKFSHKVHGWNRSMQITKYHRWHIHMSRILCYWVSIMDFIRKCDITLVYVFNPWILLLLENFCARLLLWASFLNGSEAVK